ncbi:hypothetical protein EHS25_002845 [Saitozyma podzolica]|uniref:UBX domain-containing protein n=1 Tax=Saitozyma podzolica TaxID=1890683 RepID=A0A427YC05_9TREE|nr:hypothetical protein EHS25_002845 [Saitozyma podzolica]
MSTDEAPSSQVAPVGSTPAADGEPAAAATATAATASDDVTATSTSDSPLAEPVAPAVAPSGGPSAAGGGMVIDGKEVKVFSSSSGVPAPATPDDAFFEHSLSDVQAHHASVLARSKRLNEAPLLTAKHRDEEKASREKRKADKWPTTTIRIRFSDGTQIQSTFPSSSPIQPVYAFVRSALIAEASSKTFVLWQPPRFSYPEKPVPAPKKPANPYKTHIVAPANYGPVRGGPTQGLMGGTGGKETLNELGLVPQSVLLVKWEEEEMNATGYPAPLLPELIQRSEPLPAPAPKTEQKSASGSTPSGSGAATPAAGGEKKIPKWLQKGLMKKK